MKRIFCAILFSLVFQNACFSADETAETLYAKAYASLYKNNQMEAMRIFEKAQKYYPDCAFLYAGMGDAYLKEGNLEKALEYYTLAQRKKYAIDTYKIDFYSTHLLKTTQEISASLNKLFEATKNIDSPVLYQNIKYILDENFEQTILVTELYTNNQNVNLKSANKLYNEGQKEDALKLYLEILASNPADFRAANNAGVTLFDLKDYQLASKYLKQALNNNSNSAIILNNLALVNLRLKKFTDMEENFLKALKIKHNYFPAINNRAIANIHRGLQFYKPENIESILETINRDIDNHYAVRTLAKIYLVKGDFDSANSILEPINSTYNFKLYTQKAFTAYKNAKYDNALSYINNAIKLYSDNGIDYEIRARIYTKLGRYAEAKADFQIALEKDKKNIRAHYYLAKLLYSLGETDTAFDEMKKFVSHKKGNTNQEHLKMLFK